MGPRTVRGPRMGSDGTARRIGPIADEVLVWVNFQRNHGSLDMQFEGDALRRIELCAQAAKEASMFFDFYGIDAPYLYEKETC